MDNKEIETTEKPHILPAIIVAVLVLAAIAVGVVLLSTGAM